MTDKLSDLERLHRAASKGPWLAERDTFRNWRVWDSETFNVTTPSGRAGIIADLSEDYRQAAQDNDEADACLIAAAANFTPVAIRVIRKLVEALERQPCRERTHAEDGGEPCIVCAALSEVKKELGLE